MSLNVITLHRELSFAPEKPRVSSDQAEFYGWSFFYIKPGFENQFMELAKEVLALCKAKGAVDAYNFFASELGRDLPIAMSAGRDMSAEDLKLNGKKFWETLGEEGQALWTKGEALCRKVENISGRKKSQVLDEESRSPLLSDPVKISREGNRSNGSSPPPNLG